MGAGENNGDGKVVGRIAPATGPEQEGTGSADAPRCVKCGNPVNMLDANVQFLGQGRYQHDDCPTNLVTKHASGFEAEHVRLTQRLVAVARGKVRGATLNLVMCRENDTQKEVAVLCIIMGPMVLPVARMFDGDAAKMVSPIVPEGDEPPETVGGETEQ